jgi:hypothetical protein
MTNAILQALVLCSSGSTGGSGWRHGFKANDWCRGGESGTLEAILAREEWAREGAGESGLGARQGWKGSEWFEWFEWVERFEWLEPLEWLECLV